MLIIEIKITSSRQQRNVERDDRTIKHFSHCHRNASITEHQSAQICLVVFQLKIKQLDFIMTFLRHSATSV